MYTTNRACDPTRPGFAGKLYESVKSLAKTIIHSHRKCFSLKNEGDRLIILGNGPSLNETIEKYRDKLAESPLMAVNFAANSDIFKELKPRYYVLADPHFFKITEDSSVVTLRKNLGAVDWKMTLFLPHSARKTEWAKSLANIDIAYYNAVGAEGFDFLTDLLYRNQLAMPRPRNVLIPSIMIGIWLGYKEIIITGADHSWMKTLSVDEENRVVSIQPHFYKDNDKELKRIRQDYSEIALHQIIHSFFVAFRAYHDIRRYADAKGISIYNATPESFIDAFERKSL